MQDSGLPQQFSPKRTVTIPQIERRVNQSSLNRDAKEPSCDNREEQYGISNESPQFPEGSHRLGCGYRRRRRTGRMLAERRLDRRIRRGRTGGWHRPVSFSEETDVLILGTGIAGMSAAMDPVEAGHKVMLVDKLDRVGGESFIACGVMNVVGSKMQKDAGIEGDPEQMWEKFLPVLEKKGETDDMDYKHNVYVYPKPNGRTAWPPTTVRCSNPSPTT